MSIQIKTPNITAASDRERLAQIQSYLYQMAQQLQWAFNTIETGGVSAENNIASPIGKTAKVSIDAETTFATLKNLIIKSADIMDAYYEKINKRLEGEYVAQSDFGVFSEKTTQDIEANSTGIEQLFLNIQSLADAVEKIEDSTISTSAYLKSGLLYYADDGTPVYGLEIGQTNTVDGVDTFDKFARFTSDRLSFYDRNDVEVAYISDYKLFITNAEIGSLTVGQYNLDTTDGMAFVWIGG